MTKPLPTPCGTNVGSQSEPPKDNPPSSPPPRSGISQVETVLQTTDRQLGDARTRIALGHPTVQRSVLTESANHSPLTWWKNLATNNGSE